MLQQRVVTGGPELRSKRHCLPSARWAAVARQCSSSPSAPCIVTQRQHIAGLPARPQFLSERGISTPVQTRASTSGNIQPAGNDSDSGNRNGLVTALIAIVLFAAGLIAAMSTPQGVTMRDALLNGPLGKSGFLAAFSLIFVSEIGDKTFFIAGLLAMKLGRWLSFAGSLASLGVMTIISVAIGVAIGKVPDALKSSVPVGEILGIIMLVFFGLRALHEGLKQETGHSGADEEMAEADEAVKQAEQGGRVRRDSPVQAFIQVASLIFIAEWGDRSMLSTIALGAVQNPVGVAAGAIMGHAVATGIAVVGGAFAAKYISERQINIVSGVLFLVFAAATAWSMLA